MFKTFTLGAKKYRVKLAAHDSSNLGQAMSPLCEVSIQKKFHGRDVPILSQEQTLFHEVVHCILDEIGRQDLNENEAFVQSFALLMHQFFRTGK